VRERRLALEEAMRQERNRRLRHAARRRSSASPRKEVDAAPEETTQSATSALSHASANPKKSTGGAVNGNQLPHNLDEYRRELDAANGSKEAYRLLYYTNGHLNPADVHFFKAKGRVKEYQRHAPSPPPLRSSPHRPSRHDEDSLQLLAIMPPPAEGMAEQWTKSALLRMQANKRALKRIHDREKREAALMAPRSASRAGSEQHRQTETAATQRRVATPPRDAAPLASPPPAPAFALPVPQPPPSSVAPPMSQDFQWKAASRFQGFVVAAATTPASASRTAMRWSPPRQERSPPRSYFNSSPLRWLRSDGAAQTLHVAQRSPFKPSLTYSTSSLQTSRVEPNAMPSNTHVSLLEKRATATPRKPLLDSWTASSRGSVHSGHQPTAPQGLATASSSLWESRRSWEGFTRRSSPLRLYDDHRPSLFSHKSAAAPSATTAPSGTAEVEVSPLTPSPAMKTVSRSGDDLIGTANQPPPTEASKPVQQKPSLLDGFRMPETILKRDDLFQGTS
jgi:hypothetical protein